MHLIGLLIQNKTDRQILAKFLESAGYAVQLPITANNCIENWQSISAIIIDEITARHCYHSLFTLKANSARVLLPLLLLLPPKAVFGKWLKLGFDDEVRYPLTKAELLARLQNLLNLRIQSQELNQHLKLKDEFLATVSHELRTPLTAILGWIRLIQDGRLDPTNIKHGLNVIERNAKAQAQLIEDILDISRIITGKLRLEKLPINLATIIEAAVDTIRPNAAAKDIQLFLTIESDLLEVQGDANRLQQIVWNLLNNAVKFTPESGSIEVYLRPTGKYAEIFIRDTGEGISPEFLPHIFERFRQADGSTSRRHGGLGLGLSIVRHLVELHDGQIMVESPGKDQGTSFSILLPLSNTSKQPVQKPNICAQQPLIPIMIQTELLDRSMLANTRILIVDDDPTALELICMTLNEYLIETRSCRSVADAFTLLQQWQPDLIISDLAMPEVDGYSFISQLRNLPPEAGSQIPAIALSAITRTEEQTRALLAGFQMCLAKPIDAELLITGLQTLIIKTKSASPSH